MRVVVLSHGTGGAFGRVTAYAARATLLLSFIFLVEQFNGIIRPATLIIPQNPRRNPYGPIKILSIVIIHQLSHFVKSSDVKSLDIVMEAEEKITATLLLTKLY